MTEFYRVKTDLGYHYTTGQGRYGRVDGEPLWAEILCQEHATLVAENIKDLVPQVNPRLEVYKGHVKCRLCQEQAQK